MNSIQKIKNIVSVALLFGVLFFTNCSIASIGIPRLTASKMDTFDITMGERIIQEYKDSLPKGDKTRIGLKKDTTLIYPKIVERYYGELCECLVESDHILQMKLRSNPKDCKGKILGYQRFRLNRIQVTSTKGDTLSLYTFAAIKEINNQKEWLQNFYISEAIIDSFVPASIVFKKRYNYDYPRWIHRSKRPKAVNYIFERDTNPALLDTVCFNKIISEDYNMIGGNKPLVFDITQNINSKGIVLVHQIATHQ